MHFFFEYSAKIHWFIKEFLETRVSIVCVHLYVGVSFFSLHNKHDSKSDLCIFISLSIFILFLYFHFVSSCISILFCFVYNIMNWSITLLLLVLFDVLESIISQQGQPICRIPRGWFSRATNLDNKNPEEEEEVELPPPLPPTMTVVCKIRVASCCWRCRTAVLLFIALIKSSTVSLFLKLNNRSDSSS